MWGMVLILLGVVIFVWGGNAIMKKRDFKELVFFSLFLALGVGLSVAKSMGILIPNFFDLIFRIYEPLDDFINRL